MNPVKNCESFISAIYLKYSKLKDKAVLFGRSQWS